MHTVSERRTKDIITLCFVNVTFHLLTSPETGNRGSNGNYDDLNTSHVNRSGRTSDAKDMYKLVRKNTIYTTNHSRSQRRKAQSSLVDVSFEVEPNRCGHESQTWPIWIQIHLFG